MSTALTAGVRETRRIRGEYMLTKEDVLSMRRFPDAVVSHNAPVVKHTADGKDAIFVLMGSEATRADSVACCGVRRATEKGVMVGRGAVER